MRSLPKTAKELTAVRVGTGICHGQDTGLIVSVHKVFVVKIRITLRAVNAVTASAVPAHIVSALRHETGNDAVEAGPPVAFTSGTLEQCDEIADRAGHRLIVQLQIKRSQWS